METGCKQNIGEICILAQFVNFYDKKYNMGKDKKKDADRQRCLPFKRKSELSKYKAFHAYAQIKKPGLIEAFEAEQATLNMVDSSTTDFTHWLVQTAKAATPTNFEAPVLEPTKTIEASTATSTDTSPKPPTTGLDPAGFNGFFTELSNITFKIQRLKQKFY